MLPELARRLRQSSVEVRSGGGSGGSGVIWPEGVIVTNAHVVRSRDPLVVLSDGREFRAEIVRHDRRRDLALLRIAAGNLTPAEIGDSASLRVGQTVTAVGNPLGLVGAVSTGIIFAFDQDRRWIQADVRLAPGNSGGMLADAQGRVIGINTMIYGGLAMAIPSNAAAIFVRRSPRFTGAQAA
jgi:serine protease Do